jgi:hypothetical protein
MPHLGLMVQALDCGLVLNDNRRPMPGTGLAGSIPAKGPGSLMARNDSSSPWPQLRAVSKKMGQSQIKVVTGRYSIVWVSARVPMQPLAGWAAWRECGCAAPPSIIDSRRYVATQSGRSAMTLALTALGVTAGHVVLIPNYYCPTMVAPVEVVGAKPCFYPITSTGEPDVDWIRRQDLTGVRALLAVHFFGIPCDFSEVSDFARCRGIPFIEDCSHAFFGEINGRPVGACGNVAIGSAPKTMPVSNGGFLVVGDTDLAIPDVPDAPINENLRAGWKILEQAANYGRLGSVGRIVSFLDQAQRTLRGAQTGNEISASYVSADDVRAVALRDPLLAVRAMTSVEDYICRHVARSRIAENRRRNYQSLVTMLQGLPTARILSPTLSPGAVPYVVPVYLDEPGEPYRILRAWGMPVSRWDRYWPGAPQSSDDVGRAWGHHVIQVACHQDLSDNDLLAIASSVRAAVELGVPR